MAHPRRNLCADILQLIDAALADHESALAAVAVPAPPAPIMAKDPPGSRRPGTI